VIDANNVRKEQFRDVRSQITTVNEFNNGGSTSSVMNGGKPGIWTSRRRLELSHLDRWYGKDTSYVTYPGLPEDLVFPRR
jgi:hypothetical protein